MWAGRPAPKSSVADGERQWGERDHSVNETYVRATTVDRLSVRVSAVSSKRFTLAIRHPFALPQSKSDNDRSSASGGRRAAKKSAPYGPLPRLSRVICGHSPMRTGSIVAVDR